MIDLHGQRILVTGASKGIGLTIAELLLQKGSIVAVHYNKTREHIESLLNTYGEDSVFPVQSDLEELNGAEHLFKRTLDQLSGLDSVVVNAGIFEPHPIDNSLDSWIQVWNRTMNINLNSAGVLTKLCLEHFKNQNQGRLIYIGSRAAFRGETEDYLAYAASKGGLTSLAKSVARSFGKYDIKAFVIAPGFTKTEMAMEAIAQIGEEEVLRNLALNRLTTPADIAPLVALMCSGQMDHATGTTVDMNAGSHIR